MKSGSGQRIKISKPEKRQGPERCKSWIREKCWKEWQNQKDVKDAKAGKRVRTRKTVKSGSGQTKIRFDEINENI